MSPFKNRVRSFLFAGIYGILMFVVLLAPLGLVFLWPEPTTQFELFYFSWCTFWIYFFVKLAIYHSRPNGSFNFRGSLRFAVLMLAAMVAVNILGAFLIIGFNHLFKNSAQQGAQPDAGTGRKLTP